MTDSTETDIVERLRLEASECRFEGLNEPASHLESAAAEIAKLRAERDAASRDMRERCAKVVESYPIDNGHCPICWTADGTEKAIRALPLSIIATEGATP